MQLAQRAQMTARDHTIARDYGLAMVMPKNLDSTATLEAPKRLQYSICFIECYAALEGVICGHRLCRACSKERFACAIRDEALMPPRCCQVPFLNLEELAKLFLNLSELADFRERLREFKTMTLERLYCRNKSYSKFLNKRHETFSRIAISCRACQTITCACCAQEQHNTGGACVADLGAESELKRLLSKFKWTQCEKCRRFIERSFGCNHTVSKCGKEFCFTCRKPWRSCQCA